MPSSDTLRPVPAPSFYVPAGDDAFTATTATVGPWSPKLQHAGPPIALVARALERLPGGPDGARVARVTIEILGPVPVDGVLQLEAQVVRPGGKIAMLEATARIGDKILLRARAWRLTAAAGRSTEIDLTPAPPLPAVSANQGFHGVPNFGYADALEWRFVEGRFDRPGPAVLYTRPRLPLIPGETMSPLQRVLVMLDAANGVSAELDPRAWTFVPVDLTCVLFAAPATEWVGMDARTTIGDDGLGLVRTAIFDERRVIGRSLHTLWVEPRT